MRFITFSGVDGSGKSTQLEMFKNKIENEGKKVFYFHAIEFSLANKLARFFKGDKTFVPGKEKASIKASWHSLQLRKLFLLIDIVRFKSLLKNLRHKKYDYLLSDRYFYDSVVNILYLENEDTKRHESVVLESSGKGAFSRPSSKREYRDVAANNILLSFIEKHIPKPDKAFYFQISAKEIMRRDRVPEQGLDYLRDKIALFEQKKEAWGLVTIDASIKKEEIFQKISRLGNLFIIA